MEIKTEASRISPGNLQTVSKPWRRLSPHVEAMSEIHEGGCLCGAVRFHARGAPVRITVCHCSFCQRITGSAFLVEPIFKPEDIAFSGQTRTYEHRSDTSGKRVIVHFCERCGAHLMLAFERFPDVVGLFGGAFDDPNWLGRGPGKERHIFVRSAQKGVVLPANIELYEAHAIAPDGSAATPMMLAAPLTVARP